MTKKTTSNLQSRPNSDFGQAEYFGVISKAKSQMVGLAEIFVVRILLSLCVVPAAHIAHAQELEPGRSASQIVTIDRQSLFSGTQFGRRVLETVETERKRLAEETRKAEASLAKEELELSKKRDTLDAEEFRALAKAFDEKVQALRVEGEQREAEFVRTLEREQGAFFDRIGPILWELMRELGAVVILDRRAILLTAQNIDITALAVERIDTTLGDGTQIQTPEAGENPAQDGLDPTTSPDNQ